MAEQDAVAEQLFCARCQKMKTDQALVSLLPSGTFAPDATPTLRFAQAIEHLCSQVRQLTAASCANVQIATSSKLVSTLFLCTCFACRTDHRLITSRPEAA
jgi:hypothetical protein